MNECEKIQELISCLVDSGLSAEEEALVKEHIAGCEDCRAMYEAFAAVSGEMRKDAADVPAGLHDSIMAGVYAAAKKKKRGVLVRLRPIATAAACFVVVFAGIFALARGGMGDSASSSTASAANNAASAPAAYSRQENYDTEAAAEDAVAEEAESAEELEPCEEENGKVICTGDRPPEMWTVELLSAKIIMDGEERVVEEPDTLRQALAAATGDLEFDVEAQADGGCTIVFETADGSVEVKIWFVGEHVYVKSDWMYVAAETAVYKAVCTPGELLSIK